MSTYGTGTYGSGTYGTPGTVTIVSTFPSLGVQIAFASNPGAETPSLTNVSQYVMGFTAAHGRQMELNQMETGRGSVTLNNLDRRFDPSYTGSPYYPNVIPVRYSEIKVTQSGIVYDIFAGDIPDWPLSRPFDRTSTVDLLDAFDALSDATFTLSTVQERTGTRINAILDAIGFPLSKRAIDPGISEIIPLDYENANALSEINLISQSEQGTFFFDGRGYAVFHDRHRRSKDPYLTPMAAFSDRPTGAELPISDGDLTFRRQEIYNKVTVTRRGGDFTYTVEDATSQGKYRPRTLPGGGLETLLVDENEIVGFAEALLSKYKEPRVRIDSITLEPQLNPALWQLCLGAEVSDRLTLELNPKGPAGAIVQDVFIENVAHEVERGAWTTVFRLSPSDQDTYWILGSNTLGGVSTRLGW